MLGFIDEQGGRPSFLDTARKQMAFDGGEQRTQRWNRLWNVEMKGVFWS